MYAIQNTDTSRYFGFFNGDTALWADDQQSATLYYHEDSQSIHDDLARLRELGFLHLRVVKLT